MLQNQTPEYYSNPFIFGVNNCKLAFIIFNTPPAWNEIQYFVADEDLNGKTIKGISLADISALSGTAFANYTILNPANYLTLTLKNEKNVVVVDNLPVALLSITSNAFVPGRYGKKFKTKIKTNIGGSFVKWGLNSAPILNYPAVLPFVFYY